MQETTGMNTQTKVMVIGCGGFLGLVVLMMMVSSFINTMEQKQQAAAVAARAQRAEKIKAEREAAFNALTPQQHLDAVTKSLDAGQIEEVDHHLSMVPETFAGHSDVKTRFDKLQVKLKTAAEAKVKAAKIAHEKAVKAKEQAAREAERKQRAAWRKEGVIIGMTAERVLLSSWGRPNSVNRTTYSHGVHEQWVYDGGYLYFEDGILTTIQN